MDTQADDQDNDHLPFPILGEASDFLTPNKIILFDNKTYFQILNKGLQLDQ